MNTFEKHFEDFPDFVATILGWSPHYIVPVAKKACKLLNSLPSDSPFRRNPEIVKYRNFFKLSNASVEGKRIAVVDDASQYTSTLQEYRRYFENLGATVRTFSFVGHEAVVSGRRWKEDAQAEIAKSLPEPVYQEYILQQSYHLLKSGSHFDLDHLVFSIDMSEEKFGKFLNVLRTEGLLLYLEDYFLRTEANRFSLDSPRFFRVTPFISHRSISLGSLRKLKFSFDASMGRLFFSPLVFPEWKYAECDVGAALFQSVPFKLPYALPPTLDKTNEGALLRVYQNLYFACAVSFAKAFTQHVLNPNGWNTNLALRRNDLDAVFGVATTDTLVETITPFVSGNTLYSFTASDRRRHETRRRHKGKYSEFGQVIDDLKRGYERKLEKKGSRIGIHYYLGYDKLYSEFGDKASLSEGLDYYCDFGIVVPETIIERNNGRIIRACRAGEPSPDFNWRRTQVLIPLAIDQFCSHTQPTKGMDATLLNKVLANFVFDYPTDSYHELHCLIGEPYLFGTFIRVHHPHRAARNPPLYEASRISEFYSWDVNRKVFLVRKPKKLAAAAREVFDERQEVPYSEVVTYFRFLAQVYMLFKRRRMFTRNVDVLNMFSICRDENYFYTHVLYNLTGAMEDLALSFDTSKAEMQKYLRGAREQAEAAENKVLFGETIGEAIRVVEQEFAPNLEFANTAVMFCSKYRPFSSAFGATNRQLHSIIGLALAIIDFRAVHEFDNSSRIPNLKRRIEEGSLREFGVATADDISSLVNNPAKYSELCQAVSRRLRNLQTSLPRPEPLLMTRLRQDSLERARNIATNYVYQNELSKLVLLYIDFTGFRSIPEPKEDVISKYYDIVAHNARERNGDILYGGRGGDDAFTIAYREVGPALECAKDIKADFSGDLFLSAEKRDVKFGLAFRLLSDDRKEKDTIECWGEAKDCCEYKSPTFRNRGHLIVSRETVANLHRSSTFTRESAFLPMLGEKLKNGSELFSYEAINPLSDGRK